MKVLKELKLFSFNVKKEDNSYIVTIGYKII
jgi:hypothetical protein